MNIRLNKYLASLGVASRRQIDKLTSENRILINGKTAIPGDKVNPDIDKIAIDQKIITSKINKLVYYALNKPKHVLSTTYDDRHRDTVLDYVPRSPRVFPVGRLDLESTGLILLTNDGELSLRLTHPRYHLPKVYLVTVLGKVPPSKISTMNRSGAKVKIISYLNNQTIIEITLYTGKKRQIRLLCASLHLHLLNLHRLAIGPLKLGHLKPGEYRTLTPREIDSLKY